MSPRFLTVEDVMGIHFFIISEYGGSLGVLNRGLLESAVGSPAASFGGHFLNEFPFEMAASLLIGLALNHAFVDGNKRTASMACLSFLELNDVRVEMNDQALEQLVMDVATRTKAKRAVSIMLCQYGRLRT